MRIAFLITAFVLQLVSASSPGASSPDSPKSDLSELSPIQKFGVLRGIQMDIIEEWRGLRRRLAREDPEAKSQFVSLIARTFARLDDLPYPLSDGLMRLRDDSENRVSAKMIEEYMSELIQVMREYRILLGSRLIEEDHISVTL